MRGVGPAKRRMAQLAAVAMVATVAMVSPSSPAVGAPPADAGANGPDAVPGELLVGYDAGATAADRSRARGRSEVVLEERVVAGQGATGEVELVRLPPGKERAAAVRELESDPAVAYAEPNWIYTHAATPAPTDTYYANGSLWGMYGDGTTPTNQYGSQAGEAWSAGNTGSAGVYVGVIDEGIQYTHPDLDANVWTNPFDAADGLDNDGNGKIDDIHGWDFDGNNNTIYDGGTSGGLDDHGTHVSGTIGAKPNNGVGVVGMNWNVTLISGKFLGSNGGTTSNAIRAVDYFTDLKTRHGLNIVATNNSWGGGGFSQGLLDAIVRGARQNILFIAAAGNGGANGVGDNNDSVASYPSNYNTTSGAGYDSVIAVAAITSSGAKASFSNYGSTTVDIGAPGSGVWSTTAYNGYSSYGGTSMATPHVTGAAALYKAANPTANAAAVKSAILSSAVATSSLSGKTATGGRLNVSGFVAPASTPPGATAPSAPVNLAATGGEGRIDLIWSPPASDGSSTVTGYNVYRNGSFLFSTTAPSATDTLSNGGTFSYVVKAVNAVGEGAASNIATATATASQTPARSVTVTPGVKKRNVTPVTVTWAGFGGTNVDITRSGTTFPNPNSGSLTESWRGTGTVTYTICETGTSICESGSATI